MICLMRQLESNLTLASTPSSSAGGFVTSNGGYPQCSRCASRKLECVWRRNVITDRMEGTQSKSRSCEPCTKAKASCVLPSIEEPKRKNPSKRPTEDDDGAAGPSKRAKKAKELTEEEEAHEERHRLFCDAVLAELSHISARVTWLAEMVQKSKEE